MAIALAAQQKAKVAFAGRLPDNAQSDKASQINFPVKHAAPSSAVRLTITSTGNSHSDQIAANAITYCVSFPRRGTEFETGSALS
jgi:hypothetical protein